MPGASFPLVTAAEIKACRHNPDELYVLALRGFAQRDELNDATALKLKAAEDKFRQVSDKLATYARKIACTQIDNQNLKTNLRQSFIKVVAQVRESALDEPILRVDHLPDINDDAACGAWLEKAGSKLLSSCRQCRDLKTRLMGQSSEKTHSARNDEPDDDNSAPEPQSAPHSKKPSRKEMSERQKMEQEMESCARGLAKITNAQLAASGNMLNTTDRMQSLDAQRVKYEQKMRQLKKLYDERKDDPDFNKVPETKRPRNNSDLPKPGSSRGRNEPDTGSHGREVSDLTKVEFVRPVPEDKAAPEIAERDEAVQLTAHHVTVRTSINGTDSNSCSAVVIGNELFVGNYDAMALYNFESKIRMSKSCDVVMARIKQFQSEIRTVEDIATHTRFEISAVTHTDIFSYDDSQYDPEDVKKIVRDMLDEDPDDPNSEKNIINRGHMHYCANTMRMMVAQDGKLYFDPNKQNLINATYGARPLFVHGETSISQNGMVNLMHAHINLCVPINRICNYVEDACGKKLRDRSTWIEDFNGTARAFFSRVAEMMGSMLLRDSHALHADETPVKVTSMCIAAGKSKVQLWVVRTPPRAPLKGAYFKIAPSRGADVFVDLFRMDHHAEELRELKTRVRVVTCDGLKSYDAALKQLNEMLGVDGTGDEIVLNRCWAHVRRKFVYVLRDAGLWELFGEFTRDGNKAFEKEFAKYQDEHADLPISDSYACVMRVVLLINSLFGVERKIARYKDEDVLEIRESVCRPILDEIFGRIHALAEVTGCVDFEEQPDGRYKTWKLLELPWAEATMYAINCEHDCYTFLTDPEVRVENNLAESALRRGVLLADTRILQTVKGAMTQSSLMTIDVTCRMNGVNTIDYLCWLVQMIKMRLDEVRRERRCTTQVCYMPKPMKYTAKDKKGHDVTRTLDLYDKDYSTPFDDVDISGLDVWNYVKLAVDNAPVP